MALETLYPKQIMGSLSERMWDIIPDIHGYTDKLTQLLRQLGYCEIQGAWRHANLMRTAIFLGDFIDKGPDNKGVIKIVRRMLDAGTAQAIMGNHELNAIHFHTLDSTTGLPLRAHSQNNIKQHRSFLAQYSIGDTATQDAIGWMKTLPFFLDMGGFRIVHASWSDNAVAVVREHCPNQLLTSDMMTLCSADENHPLQGALDILLKGPQIGLPDGWSFQDKDDYTRTEARVAWWENNARTWRDLVVSVPDVKAQIPAIAFPAGTRPETYPETAPPVLFGHYRLNQEPVLQGKNVMCLDFARDAHRGLPSYLISNAQAALDVRNIQNWRAELYTETLGPRL